MLNKTFFSHPLKNQILTYEHLIYKLNLLESIPFLIKTNNLTEYYVNLIAHIVNSSDCVLLDQDFHQHEMINVLGNDLEDKSSELTKRFYKNIDSEAELLKEIEN